MAGQAQMGKRMSQILTERGKKVLREKTATVRLELCDDEGRALYVFAMPVHHVRDGDKLHVVLDIDTLTID